MVGFLTAAPCLAQGRFDLAEYSVPGFAGGIVGGPDGAVWFTLVLSNSLGRITPDGVITRFSLASAGPFSIVVALTLGSDGALWYAKEIRSFDLTRTQQIVIGRLTTSGENVEFTVPLSVGRIPGLAAGPDGAIWFTEATGNRIGRITPDGHLAEFALPGPTGSSSSIVRGPDDALWFTQPSGIGRITTSGEVSEFPLNPGARPVGITAGGDGAVWFTESSTNSIGRITPTGDVSSFFLSTTDRPGAIVWGADGALWFTESGNKIGRMTTQGSFAELAMPRPRSSPTDIALGPDGAVWFSEQLAGRLGRAIFDPSSPRTCTAGRATLCLNGGRFEVTTAWETATASGPGVALQVTPETGCFWFFSENNVEVIVKALDGCALNERYWLFEAGLTDVAVYTVVTDTRSGLVRTYENFRGTPFVPVADTNAFRACP